MILKRLLLVILYIPYVFLSIILFSVILILGTIWGGIKWIIDGSHPHETIADTISLITPILEFPDKLLKP
jgi:hypothetical protein